MTYQLRFLFVLALVVLSFGSFASAQTVVCGSPEKGHYFEIDRIDNFTRMMPGAAMSWYVDGQLKASRPSLYPMAWGSSSGFRFSVDLKSGKATTEPTKVYWASPVTFGDDDTVFVAVSDGNGKSEIVITKSTNGNFSSSDPRLSCSPRSSASGGGSGAPAASNARAQ